MLKLSNVSVSYGPVAALRDVSFSVEAGTVCAVVGANGAGKSTLMKAICGLVPVQAGDLFFDGESITGFPAERRVALGIALSPEGRRLFPELTVRENLLMGAYLRKDMPQIREDIERVYGYFPRLRERASSQGRHLSGGEQQMCAIGRALMSEPKLVLLDEPSMGLAPVVVAQVFDLVRRIRSEGYTVLIVEQNVAQVLKVVDRAYLIEVGKIARSGKAAELAASEDIRKAYLGI